MSRKLQLERQKTKFIFKRQKTRTKNIFVKIGFLTLKRNSFIVPTNFSFFLPFESCFAFFFHFFNLYLQYFLLNESVVSWAKQKIFFYRKKWDFLLNCTFVRMCLTNERESMNCSSNNVALCSHLSGEYWIKGRGGIFVNPFWPAPSYIIYSECVCEVLYCIQVIVPFDVNNTRELFFSKTRFNILHVSVPNVFHHFLMLQEEEEAISLCCCQCCWKDDFFLVYTFEPIRRKWAWWQFCRLYAERASRGYIRYSDGSAAYVIRLHTWTGYISGNHTQRIGMFLSRL